MSQTTKSKRFAWRKKIPILHLSALELGIILLLVIGGTGAIIADHYPLSSSTNTAQATTLSSAKDKPVIDPSTTPVVAPTQSTTTPQQPKTSTTTNHCSSIEAGIEQNYESMAAADWSAWSNETSKYTQAEINYEYNQSIQGIYNQDVQAIQSDGCTSNLTLALKYPATNPYSVSTEPSTPPTPTCDTSAEASYQNIYESQYQELLEQENEEIQSLQAQIAAAGGGVSSAYNEVPSEVAQSFSSKFNAIKSTLNSELASIDCSGD